MAHTENNNGPIQLNLSEILRNRVGGFKGWLLGGLPAALMARIIHQKDLNELLRVAYPARGSQFADRILKHLDINVEVIGLDTLPQGASLMFASNHPLGGLDGIAMVKVLGEKYGDDHLSVLVNDMLMHVAPLRDVFLPINKYGGQARNAAEMINHACHEKDRQIVMFPAGLVSRLHDDGGIRDLPWQKAFVTKALKSGRLIVPVKFEALNTRRFYKLARLRKNLGVKVNLEQVLLPSEIMKSRGKHFRIVFGTPVDPASLQAEGLSPEAITRRIRVAADSL